MKFIYQARTKEGELKSGIIEASSKEIALFLLQKLGYYVTYLEEEKLPIYAREIRILSRISSKDILLFFRQFSILLGAQVPIVEALMTLSAQIKNPEFKEIILDIAKEVDAGSSLSKAFSKHSKIFTPLHIAMIKTGEASGRLAQSLTYLADHLEKEYNFKRRLLGIALYPLIVFLLFLGVGGMLMFGVLPTFESILMESEAEIPFITKTLLIFSRFCRKNFFPITLILLPLLVLLLAFSKSEKGKKFFDRLILKIPFFGEIFKQSILAKIGESLATLTSAGLTITESLELVEETMENEVYKEAIFKLKEGIKKGEPISSTSSLYPELFPPLFNQLVLVGEKTGTLPSCFFTLSTFYQGETERSLETFLKILEPSLIIILGILIGGLMASVLIPLYQITTTY